MCTFELLHVRCLKKNSTACPQDGNKRGETITGHHQEGSTEDICFFQLTGGLTDDLIPVYIFFVRESIEGGAHLCIGDRTKEWLKAASGKI